MEKELCVRCGIETEYDMNYPVDMRRYFIEGSGQLCPDCYTQLYGSLVALTKNNYEPTVQLIKLAD